MPAVSACQAGEVIAVRQSDGRCGEAVVKAACQDKTKGHWYCATHREHFANQFMKDVHIGTSRHRMVWICHEHGAEQP